ncbi:hypothetical protein [Novosphingobium sp.]|uniref:hypothetical protein n=1 Tax=Novosphingobium sp. TaxID=1874826 RepID=UPI00286A33B0|nr:hypothetical protein [Novosphingobium sp.]
MHREGEEIHITTTEAKGGNKGSFLFQILVISLAVIVVVFGGLWLFGSATSTNTGGPVTIPTVTAT